MIDLSKPVLRLVMRRCVHDTRDVVLSYTFVLLQAKISRTRSGDERGRNNVTIRSLATTVPKLETGHDLAFRGQDGHRGGLVSTPQVEWCA